MGSSQLEKVPCRSRSGRISALVVLLLAAVTSSSALRSQPTRAASQELEPRSAAGDLDPSFGNGGRVLTDFSGNDDVATALAIQSDGKIVVGGTIDLRGNPDFALVRYNTDGSLDPTFGSNGKVTTDFFQHIDLLNGIAVQSDGKILAAGSASHAEMGSEFALARYNSDGSLDLGFGASGKTTTNLSGDDVANAVTLRTDGKIVTVGSSFTRTFPKFALARYNPDGSLDTSFGENGKVINSLPGGFDQARAVVLQPDNKIVIAGDDHPTNRFAVFRYNANGSPDTGFGAAGGVTTAVSLFSAATAIGLQSDGKIVAAGFAEASLLKLFFGLARYNPDGSPDSAFGDFGRVVTSISNRDDVATALAIQSDGKILAAGFAGAPGDFGSGFADFAIARYRRKGKLDSTFGMNGIVLTDFSGRSDMANAITLQSDGKIVLAGVAQTTTNVFAIARYLVEDFSLGFAQPVISAARATTVPVEILINHLGGFTGTVTITPPDTSTIGVKVKPAGPIITTHLKATILLKVRPSAPIGSHRLTFNARDGQGRVRTAEIVLNIQ